MIVKMRKITFIGIMDEKERFLQRLQGLGVTHITLPTESLEPVELSRELQKVTEIRKFLSRIADKDRAAKVSDDYTAVCSLREELAQRESRLQGEINTLKKERAQLEPWGEFDPQDVALLRSKGLDVRFYRVPHRNFDNMALDDILYHITRRTEGEVAFIALASAPLDIGLAEEKLPAKSLSRIDGEIEAKNRELLEIKKEYAALAAEVQTLIDAEHRLKDDYEYQRVLMNTASFLNERLFVLSCWSPIAEEELMERIGPDFTLGHYSESPEPGDRVPVLLSNPPVFDSGEDLVNIYSPPNYNDFDPSATVLYCFAVFYGMIIGDAGYGFSLLALTIFLHWRIKSKAPFWIRFRRLNYLLSVSVIFFGIISASYFGILLRPDNPLKHFMLIDYSTKAGMNHAMLVSILFGMVHLSIAQGIKFFRTRDLSSLGWIIVIWSGYALLSAKMVKGIENPVALRVLIGGFVLVVLFTSKAKNPVIRILAGFNGALSVVQLFADVLSYLRLFALGLATMYMCQTFNMLAGMPYHALPYIGFLPAGLILLFGHMINIILGIMGGVVHGLRLNFLEWYRWCFEGDGVPFKPFRRIAKAA
jgi:V/A-type H+-transporting ATPase subunit I